MAIQREDKVKEAWGTCDFCSKSNLEIANIIKSEDWSELPIGYKCGWKRICQVGFGRFGKTQLWKDLTSERSELNNVETFGHKRSWSEPWCSAYNKLND